MKAYIKNACIICYGSCLLLTLPAVAWSQNCVLQAPQKSIHTEFAVPVSFGKINLLSAWLQPPGTLISRVVTPARNTIMAADTVLWDCQKSAVASGAVYFLAAVKGNDKYGGYALWDGNNGFINSAADGSGIYATWYPDIGLKLTMEGQTLSRTWKKIAVTRYDTQGDRAIIRLHHVPDMLTELYRVTGTVIGTSPLCSDFPENPEAEIKYYCIATHAYLQLHPGDNSFTHDEVGQDSRTSLQFSYPNNGDPNKNNGITWSMSNITSPSSYNLYIQKQGCAVRSPDQHVTFPTISKQQLEQGITRQQNFNIELACDNNADVGTASGQTAIGFMVSSGAHHVARVLINPPLVTTDGLGVTHLMADCYDCNGTAQGVGVTLQNPAMAAGNLNFVSYPGISTGSGNTQGWYDPLQGATISASSQGDYKIATHTFTATFGRVHNLAIKPGKFEATATVLVKMQ